MRALIFVLLINLVFVTCHKVIRRETDEEGYDWDAGPPKYEHFHYAEDGEVDFAPRIIGGTPAWHGEFLAKISLQTRGGNHFCGGALIDLRHVLTAAHCLTTSFGVVVEVDSIRLMGDDLSIQRHGSPTRQIRWASHLFAHPDFDIITYAADIGVIRVTMPFIQTTTLRPVTRSVHTPADNLNCNLAGWGTTAETNVRPHLILLRVELDIIPMTFCNGSQSYHGSIPPNFICAGTLDGSRDACFGDSGGGLICNNQIAGIVSFGFGCGRRNFPGAYADVSQFNSWIQECLASNVPHEELPRPSTADPNSSVAKLFVSARLMSAILLAMYVLTQ